MAFDPKSYWEQRLTGAYNLKGVGDIGLSESINRLMYDIRAHAFARAIRSVKSRLRDFEALDIGSGTGFYIDLLMKHGASPLSGCDLTEAAVTALKRRFSSVNLFQLDLSAALPDSIARGSYDVVSCMDVLFHIVDDRGYTQAFENFAALVKSQGMLIFSENFLESGARITHQVGRTDAEISQLLDRNGFDIIHTIPMFVLMNDPVRAQGKMPRRIFHRAYSAAVRHPRLAGLAANLIYPLELALVSTMTRGPSTEIKICVRR